MAFQGWTFFKKIIYNGAMGLFGRTIKKYILFFLLISLGGLYGQTGQTALILRYFPQDSQILLDGIPVDPDVITGKGEYRTFFLSSGLHHLTLYAEGYLSQDYPLTLSGGEELIEGKLEKPDLPIYQLEELPTAHQPKSVTFSPDGEYLAVASLGSNRGLQIYTLHPFAHLIDLIPPPALANKTGFVESCWLPQRNEVWVSQMNTGKFHIFSTVDWSYIGSYDTGGTWSKVLLPKGDESRVYISNWDSETVTEIDVETREILRIFPVSGIPRGLTLSPDDQTLLVSIFSANALDSVNLETGEVSTKRYSGHSGAMRHFVSDRRRGLHYITNMQLALVYAISDRDGSVQRIYQVGQKPNSAAMSPDGRYLFVSCRGPNNPKSYLIEGPEFGRVYIIDLEKQQVLGWIWGRDQTTGLDVSPDSRYLAFTDFKDNCLELYGIQPLEGLWKE
jgi:YVTN family beta-propeller protein